MKVLVSGSHGLVGSALIPFLSSGGHEPFRLVRTPPSGERSDRVASWDPAKGQMDLSPVAALDAAVHLAGENIAAGRWTPAQKDRIRHSRVQGTRLLAETLARQSAKPKVLVCASAVGYYGDRGSELLHEGSEAGYGFLPDVCREWEGATKPAAECGIRVVHLRIGLVLSPAGGALAKMLTPFKLGVGGKIGSGEQYMSWIALDDLVAVIHHALIHKSLAGPVNAVAPHPVSNLEFTKTLGKVLKRPTLAPLPAFAARLMFGEMADALLLASARAEPRQLQRSGYQFRFPTLESALRHVLGR
ncbi:MAG: TIGR01777 family oxidoreductase [Acidobacteriota bacterium]